MEKNLIPAKDFCLYHSIEISFIESLNTFGLLEIQIIKKVVFIHPDDVTKVEKYIRLSKDLDINMEGLHAIAHLLEQVEHLQSENNRLQNQINYYKQII